MNRMNLIILSALSAIGVCSCELDNYDYPDSGIYGRILDAETGELVQQDIIEGTKIYFVEHGYDNPPVQKMVIKNNGEYRNTLMFAGTYTMHTSTDSNFAPVEPFEIKIDGLVQHDFKVMPFIRLNNVRIYRTGNKIKANFTLSQTGYDNVSSMALFASSQPVVGAYLNDAQVIVPLGQYYSEPTAMEIELDLTDYPVLKSGRTWYFRVGALISIGGAKYNYAQAVPIEL